MKDLVRACRAWPLAPPGTRAEQAAWFASTLEGATWTELGGAATARMPSPWDGEQLGVVCARLALVIPPSAARMTSTLVAQSLADATAAGVNYLVARVDAGDFAVVQELEAAGFRLVDTIVSQHMRVTVAPSIVTPGYTIRAAVAEDVPAFERLSNDCFDDTRFHTDPWIGAKRARAIYRTWSAACARGRNPFSVVAVDENGEIAAMLSAREVPGSRAAFGCGHARVELVAVDPRHRGRRLVDAMTAALVEASPGLGWDWIGIGTQAANLPALRAYRRIVACSR